MWKNPVKATPSIVQVDFGPWGQNLPGDGEDYCGPTSLVMGLYWLYDNGFTQVAPAPYAGQEDPNATNLELVIAGLANTSSFGGTGGGLVPGVNIYLAACGIGTDQYTVTTTYNPDLDWLSTQLAPNVAADPDTIVLADFSVGWYSRSDPSSTDFTNDGGHVLAPLTVDLDAGTVTLNNAYPASFLNVPNDPSSNPQTVGIVSVPSGWTLPNLGYPSQDYTQISTDLFGGDGVAILWGGDAWAISATARPTTEGYQPSIWSIDDQQQPIDTNGGQLTVLAPLAGTGGFAKSGQGTLLLTNTNDLTGTNLVAGGMLASSQIVGAPFGTGTIDMAGGTLQLSSDGSDVTVALASASDATLALRSGGNVLQLVGWGSYSVTIGGYADGVTPNIGQSSVATLVIAPGGGVSALGNTQQVVVAGSDGNLPQPSNGIVAPWLVGQDNDAASSGAFLTYDVSAGFQAAGTVLSSDMGIGNVGSADVYEVVDIQTIEDGGIAQVAALEMNGGVVDGSETTTLMVGSQSAGDVAGIIMNDGTVSVGLLSFGDATGMIYAGAGSNATISSAIGGTAGLTVFGPGTVELAGNSLATLSGVITVNSGTLVVNAASGPPAGTGSIVVASGGALHVAGPVSGDVFVAQSATLFLDGGVVVGDVSIAPTGATSSDPGGILQGSGSIAGATTVNGVVQSGPQAGIIAFDGDATIAGGASFFWRPQKNFDPATTKPGVGWNALQFNSPNSNAGTSDQYLPIYLDFTVCGGDPDQGDSIWQQKLQWPIFFFKGKGGYAYWAYENFSYGTGNFTMEFDGWTVMLVWTPSSTFQTLAQRRRIAAAARAIRLPGRPEGASL